MSTEKLSELSKPVSWADERGNLCTNTLKERGLDSKYHLDYEKYSTPLYSQEYVSALQAELERYKQYAKERDAENESLSLTVGRLRVELEAKDKRIDELEYELACVMADNEYCGKTIARKDASIDTFVKESGDAQKRIAELEAKLATPVRLPRRAPENLASVLDGYEKWLIATTFRDTWNACLDEVSRISSGFTVEGDE